jgi:hypothetical protein
MFSILPGFSDHFYRAHERKDLLLNMIKRSQFDVAEPKQKKRNSSEQQKAAKEISLHKQMLQKHTA